LSIVYSEHSFGSSCLMETWVVSSVHSLNVVQMQLRWVI